ncbi:MAG: Ppx/GppA family phosphatase [Kiritimatiellae bacterium]|nr:Ppx/GppA family phosphatase [Clostridia bacterium]MBR3923160.1 Ppx/GppA family phosphatase [Kiritimatiellia bacterium]
MRLACIGIGSNAIRLLVAQWKAGQLCVLCRERRGTRLFAGLVDGALTKESMKSSVDAIAELAELARAHGSREIFVFATSAVRDAANGEAFTAEAERRSGTQIEIISGEEEAVLSYMGASEGGSSGVIDIGGGSTEFTLGEEAHILGAASLQMGAVRMNAQTPILSLEDYEATVERCMNIIRRDAQELLAFPRERSWSGVGGTMTTLGAMQMRVPLFDPRQCEGMIMQRGEVAAWGRKIARMTLSERRQIEGLMPQRADIIPSGIAILEAAMRCFGMTQLRLSAHGNMDGYLKKKFREMC